MASFVQKIVQPLRHVVDVPWAANTTQVKPFSVGLINQFGFERICVSHKTALSQISSNKKGGALHHPKVSYFFLQRANTAKIPT
jgi:hypothetical protein